MSGRLGNGMALWLGGALLAHAALLALPAARPPAGGSVATAGLDVRLLQKPASAPKTAFAPDTASESETGAAPISEPAAEETTPAPMPRLETVPRAEMGSDPIFYPRAAEQVTVSAPNRGAGPAATTAAETRPEPISALSESPAEKASDSFADASTALAGQQVILATARPTSVATPTLDDPVQSPAGAPDERDRLRLLELTDRLHRAIERQKRYPLSARRLGREGTASVAFRLRPDGAIDDLEVAATSGEPALDRAALRAVSGISPFGEARAYLETSAPFRVDIAFRLH